MDERVQKLKTPDECERFARNARERNRPDLAQQAARRAVDLRAEGRGAASDAERDALRAVYAYEELLYRKNGRRTSAARTWQMINRYGVLEAVERAVNRDTNPSGYLTLVEMGMQDLAFEAVVMHYPQVFRVETIARARRRLGEWQA